MAAPATCATLPGMSTTPPQTLTGKHRNGAPKKLTPRHHKIVDLHLAGWGQQDIMAEVGLSRQQVRRVLDSPEAQKRVRQHQQDADERLVNLHGKAVERLSQLLDHSDPRVQLDAISKLVQLSRRGDDGGTTVNVNVGERLGAREKLAAQLRQTIDADAYEVDAEDD